MSYTVACKSQKVLEQDARHRDTHPESSRVHAGQTASRARERLGCLMNSRLKNIISVPGRRPKKVTPSLSSDGHAARVGFPRCGESPALVLGPNAPSNIVFD